MDEVKPVKLPIGEDISRCMGHDGRYGDHCSKRDTCARHMTISHLDEPWDTVKPPYYRMCSNNDYHCFMEIEP